MGSLKKAGARNLRVEVKMALTIVLMHLMAVCVRAITCQWVVSALSVEVRM